MQGGFSEIIDLEKDNAINRGKILMSLQFGSRNFSE
jgi:hypothetical protein